LIDPEEPSKLTIIAAQFEDNPQRKNPVALIASTSPDIYKSHNSDELYFRGSRSDAMAYYVDGVKITDGLSGVPPDGIASITIFTGGLPARYGDVTGGVVAIETKSYFDLYMQRQAGLR
jgi:outer membrane receptor protein involved in Fe transport